MGRHDELGESTECTTHICKGVKHKLTLFIPDANLTFIEKVLTQCVCVRVKQTKTSLYPDANFIKT